ncbi:MAG: beta-lactamase family protein [Verrucomicrobiales bacterium]|nr:beta-lactamase family protein [Verrucomicrobiales bacterium]
MRASLGKLRLLYHPGERWVYSVATDVLGRLVEKASGKSFGDFLQERLFKPLNMKDTGFHVPADKVDRFAENHTIGLLVIDHPKKSRYLKPPKMESGGGGLVSTTRDYLRFLQMIANGGTFEGKRYLKQETVNLMTTNQLSESIPFIGVGDERPGLGFGLGFSVRIGDSEWDSGSRLGDYD